MQEWDANMPFLASPAAAIHIIVQSFDGIRASDLIIKDDPGNYLTSARGRVAVLDTR
jgi:hypothetical protein